MSADSNSLFTVVETESHTHQADHHPVAAPEIDPGSGMVAITFLIGSLLVMRGHRKSKERK